MMESQTTLAVIVLYRVAAEASQAFCSLRSLMAADPQAAAAIDLFERLDILINNAGANVRKPPEHYNISEWRMLIDANLRR